MATDLNYFQLLRIPSTATAEEIKDAYEKVMVTWTKANPGSRFFKYKPLLPEIKSVLIDGEDPELERKMRSDRSKSEGKKTENIQTETVVLVKPDARTTKFKDVDAQLDKLGFTDLYDLVNQGIAELNQGISELSKEKKVKRIRRNSKGADINERAKKIYEKLRAAREDSELIGYAMEIFKQPETRDEYDAWRIDNLRLKDFKVIIDFGRQNISDDGVLGAEDLRSMLAMSYHRKLIEWEQPEKLLEDIKKENIRSQSFRNVTDNISCPSKKCGRKNWFADCACSYCGTFLDSDEIKCPAGHINPTLARFCFVDRECNKPLINES